MKTLDKYLSNLLVGFVKLHNLHWNVVGPTFKQTHEYLEELYDDFSEKFDEVAELQRMSGEFPLASVKDYLENTDVKELESKTIQEKAAIEKALELIKLQRDLAFTISEEAKEVPLVNMMEDHVADYDKSIWFMTSMIK